MRHFALVVLYLLLPACESAVKDAKPPAPTTAPKTSPDVPKDLLKPAASRPSPGGLIDVSREEVHVATLVLNEPLSITSPSEYCLDDGRLWKGSAYRLGRINVFGIDAQLAKLGSVEPVAVFGAKKENLFGRLTESGPCPEDHEPMHVQMRSDWIADEGGPNTTREKLEGLSYLEGHRAQTVHMLEVLAGDERNAHLRVRNPFSQPLASVEVKAHYEGGSGKPMPTMVEQVLALEPGASTDLHIPRQLDGTPNPGRRKGGSGLQSLRIQGQLGKAELDIELFVPNPR